MKAELKSRETYQTISDKEHPYVARVWGTVTKIERFEGFSSGPGWAIISGPACAAFLYVDEITMDGKPWTEVSQLKEAPNV